MVRNKRRIGRWAVVSAILALTTVGSTSADAYPKYIGPWIVDNFGWDGCFIERITRDDSKVMFRLIATHRDGISISLHSDSWRFNTDSSSLAIVAIDDESWRLNASTVSRSHFTMNFGWYERFLDRFRRGYELIIRILDTGATWTVQLDRSMQAVDIMMECAFPSQNFNPTNPFERQ